MKKENFDNKVEIETLLETLYQLKNMLNMPEKYRFVIQAKNSDSVDKQIFIDCERIVPVLIKEKQFIEKQLKKI